jgi:hypothetical protein
MTDYALYTAMRIFASLNRTFLILESDEDVVDGKDFNPLVTCAFTLLATLQTRSKTAFK